jgi:hypothetical protein
LIVGKSDWGVEDLPLSGSCLEVGKHLPLKPDIEDLLENSLKGIYLIHVRLTKVVWTEDNCVLIKTHVGTASPENEQRSKRRSHDAELWFVLREIRHRPREGLYCAVAGHILVSQWLIKKHGLPNRTKTKPCMYSARLGEGCSWKIGGTETYNYQ